ncbi:hypothetical protein FIA58_006940 [Flavobacterium jejuense]|uniref:Uncharacterized protein n=1 Tax=Flavobacterium jejuense TaxID=1544455 RepID=A0ABX0IRC1_9FLAO|nr:hypothetical protein [Flavobacterium jejuense]NHN25407.1 hypothetical protein [Flavobacterium jejuense]
MQYDIKKNTFVTVSRKKFLDYLNQLPSINDYIYLINESNPKEEENEFQVFIGDIDTQESLTFSSYHTLIIGNVTTKWLDCSNNNALGFDEGGSTIIMGNLTCEYFTGEYHKLVFIDKNIHVSKVLHNAFDGSYLVALGDLKATYFAGLDYGTEVGGVVELTYGEGSCLHINSADSIKKKIKPRHSETESQKFLKVEYTANEFKTRDSFLKVMIKTDITDSEKN